MHVLALLLTIASIVVPDPLAPAQEAYARAEYGRAEELAVGVAQPPREGAALYLAGLARFRAGRPAEALEALDAAGRAGDPPARGLWQYNRGACLSALGRAGEAEAAFEEAAALDPSLAALALVNAGRAALDAGSRERAAALARRARAVATGGAVALVADLEAELEGGGATGADALGEAGAEPRGLAARGLGWDASLRAGGGYDSNVLQSGTQSTREVAPAPGEAAASLAATASAAVARRWSLGALAAELAYGADQVAYATSTVRDHSLQQHAAAASLEATPGERWRAGVAARGSLAFTGLGRFRTLQRGAGAGAWLALDEGPRTATRLDVEWSRKEAPRAEFAHLRGDRVDALLSQEAALGRVALAAAYRVRLEDVGTLTQAATFELPVSLCGPQGCAQESVIPLGYTSHAVAVSARLRLGARLAAGVSAGLEWLRYRGESFLRATPLAGPRTVARLDVRRREDLRGAGELWASVRAWRRLDLILRWSAVVNRSNVSRSGPCQLDDPSCHALDYDDKDYTKHVVGLEAGWRW